jgi:hypothetical protein
MLFHKDIWHECHGYDEKLLYWGWMEGDLALRLEQKHKLIDFKDHVGNYLYHLEHYPSLTSYKDRNGAATPRKKNEVITQDLSYKTNNSEWGLYGYKLKLNSYKIPSVNNYTDPQFQKNNWLFYPIRMLKLGVLIIVDFLQVEGLEEANNTLSKFKIIFGKIREITKI